MKHGHGANAQPRATRTRDSFATTMIRAYTLIRGPGANVKRAAFRLLPWLGGRPEELTRVERASRAAASDLDGFLTMSGSSGGWARTEYGKYYATSVPVYAAIKVRSDALSRAPAVVYRTNSAGERTPVGPSHPAQHLLDRVNRWYTKPDLWRTTETFLNLWGSVFWAIERDEEGRREIWPLRPDRLTIVPDKKKHIRGFVYNGQSGQVVYTPEEMVWFRYFNPLEKYAGLSPIAPASMAVDMGKDGLRFNRNFLRNSAQPDFVSLTNKTMNDNEIEDFDRRREARFRGPAQAHRPAVASLVRNIKTLGISHREMEPRRSKPRLRRPEASTFGP